MVLLKERLRKARDYAGLTQTALAKAIGVSDRSMVTYEQNPAKITIGNLHLIADVCGVDEIWLLTGHGTMFSDGELRDAEKQAIGSDTITTIDDVIEKDHSEIIKKFESKLEARDLNVKLVDIDIGSKRAFKKVINYVDAIWDGVDSAQQDMAESSSSKQISKQKGRGVGKQGRKKQA